MVKARSFIVETACTHKAKHCQGEATVVAPCPLLIGTLPVTICYTAGEGKENEKGEASPARRRRSRGEPKQVAA